ncbi:MAG: flagellinolysin [Clostridiales bacterium]|nr:flagellinolysin [Clostridiales bacterium]
MRINTNITSINALRMTSNIKKTIQNSIQKLSSGSRINKAADDAAGLSISEKMRSQIRGLNMASRNAQDGISLLQTAEGGLSEAHEILQRSRMLAVQAANDTNVTLDKEKIQLEVDNLLEEVDRISETTEFNSINLLDGTIGKSWNGISETSTDALKNRIIEGLKSGWLSEAEKMIESHYGLTASNRDINVVLKYDEAEGTLASIQTQWSVLGDPNLDASTATISSMELNIDLYDFDPSTGEHGDNYMTVAGGSMYNDRIIAHELVHAVMADAMGDNFYDMPTWFKEGSAEFIHGADDRIAADTNPPAATTIADVVTLAVDMINNETWAQDSINYSASYLAVKYIESNLAGGQTFADIMSEIKNDADLTSDNTIDAIVNHTTFADKAAFVASLTANGANYYNTVVAVNAADTGSIGGSDHVGAIDLNAEDIVPTGSYLDNPTKFNFIFEEIATTKTTTNSATFQIGANEGQIMSISIDSISTTNLRLSAIDIVNDADEAITSFDAAIENISSLRSRLGAYQNRLEHTIKNLDVSSENLLASEARIRDVDMADEMMTFSKSNILMQAAQAMLAQSNQTPRGVLQLLR